jgi:predicted TIM-barrel fold metal-dependent hydrolase
MSKLLEARTMRYRNDPDGTRLPIKVDTTTNGEFSPRPLDAHNHAANAFAHRRASENARRVNLSRRDFLTSACGAASTLLAFNEVHAAFGKTGGVYEIPAAAALDPAVAADAVGGNEFIFDIQGHHVNPLERWRAPDRSLMQGLKFMPHGRCDYLDPDSELGHLQCYTGQAFVKEMFLDSDTDIAVLTFTPSTYENMPLTNDEAAATRELVDVLEGNNRLLLHGRVIPNLDGDLERMDELVDKWNVSAWKTYTQASYDGKSGWWLDDEEFGAPLIERARKLGVNVICCHKGLPLPGMMMSKDNYQFGSCRDVGPAARQNPDMDFIVYHAGYEPGVKEGPFVPGENPSGIDSLVQTVLDNDLGSGSNAYAELGSTWRYLMRDPDQAAHALGKLLKYVGEDNVVWGTDCIWYGSPQDQIQAFRSFQIAPELQETYGYPEITPEIRAKVFGYNAVKSYKIEPDEVRLHLDGDPMQKARNDYTGQEDPSYLTYGPKTRREFLNLARMSHS